MDLPRVVTWNMFFKKSLSENFHKIHMMISAVEVLFSRKNSIAGVFLWILIRFCAEHESYAAVLIQINITDNIVR